MRKYDVGGGEGSELPSLSIERITLKRSSRHMPPCSWKRLLFLGRIDIQTMYTKVGRKMVVIRNEDDRYRSREGRDAWPATYYPLGSRNSTPENDCIQIIPPFLFSPLLARTHATFQYPDNPAQIRSDLRVPRLGK